MSNPLILKRVILLSLVLLVTACGSDQQDNAVCDASFDNTCVGNVAHVCTDAKLVKTDCGEKVCKAGVCVDEHALACDDSYVLTCEGNAALTCVEGAVVKTDCGENVCKAGVCEMFNSDSVVEGKACTKDACLDNQRFECIGEVYRASSTCDGDTVCSIDAQGLSACLETCSEAEKGTKLIACGHHKNGSSFTMPHICSLDALGNYVYEKGPDGDYVICPASCSEGKCVKLTDDDGALCSPDEFIERCEGELAVYCAQRNPAEHIISTRDCASLGLPSFSCQVKKEGNYAGCVIPCIQGDADNAFCEPNNDDGYTLHKIACLETKDSDQYHYFPAGSETDCKTCDEAKMVCTK